MLVKRTLIARISRFLDDMLTTTWRGDAFTAILEIGALTREIMYRMIMYHKDTSYLSLNDENVFGYLSAANIVKFNEVQDLCESYYLNTLTVENCLERWMLGRRYNTSRPLMIAAQQMFGKNIHHCIKIESFFALKHRAVYRLLRSDDIDLYSEEIIFEAIIRWIHYDVDNRFQHFPYLISAVRFDYVKLSVRLRL